MVCLRGLLLAGHDYINEWWRLVGEMGAVVVVVSCVSLSLINFRKSQSWRCGVIVLAPLHLTSPFTLSISMSKKSSMYCSQTSIYEILR